MLLSSVDVVSGKNEDEANNAFPPIAALLRSCVLRTFTCYKLPQKIPQLGLIRTAYPNANVLWIVRHPYAVVSSMRTLIEGDDGRNWLQRWPESLKGHARLFPEIADLDLRAMDEVSRGAYTWKYNVMAIARYKSVMPSFRAIRYEDLVERPKAVLEPVLAAYDIPWSDSVLQHEVVHSGKRYCGNNVGSRPIDRTRVSPLLHLDDREKERVRMICRPEMDEYYPRVPAATAGYTSPSIKTAT